MSSYFLVPEYSTGRRLASLLNSISDGYPSAHTHTHTHGCDLCVCLSVCLFSSVRPIHPSIHPSIPISMPSSSFLVASMRANRMSRTCRS